MFPVGQDRASGSEQAAGGTDQMRQAGAVDVIDIGEIEQNLSMSLGEKITNPFAECGAFFA